MKRENFTDLHAKKMTNPKPCGQIQHQHHVLGNVLYCLVLHRYVALRDDWMISALGSYLKHGSSVAILIVIMDESVPSKLRAFLVSVLFSPIAENTRSASALL